VNKYWINQGAPNEAFWAHGVSMFISDEGYPLFTFLQFSKHATCTSTFDVTCYGKDYEKNAEVIDFFDAAIRAFQQFPTYNLLAA